MSIHLCLFLVQILEYKSSLKILDFVLWWYAQGLYYPQAVLDMAQNIAPIYRLKSYDYFKSSYTSKKN